MKLAHSIHLAGGGQGAMLALRRHFKAALAPLPVARPLVAYVGTASDDDAGFFTMIKAALALSRATIKLARIASPRASISAARALLESADLLFVSGGDVDHGMTVLRDRGVDGTLRDLGRAGKPMFGLSAGSIMLGREWVRFPGDDESKAELFPCLGIAPVHVDAHAEEDDWAELRTLVRLLHRRGDRRPVGHGLTKRGGLRVDLGAKVPSVVAIGTPIPRFGVRGDAVTKLAALAPEA